MTTQTDINNFTCSNTAGDLLELAAKTQIETTNRIVSVATVNDLPDLNNNAVAVGTVVYVESIKIPVIAQIGCWSGLDNRELRNDFNVGIAWAWGGNSCGRLGDGTATNRLSPVSVIGGFNDWCQVSTGGSHTVGLRDNGTAWTWGDNTFSQLGSGTGTTSSPVSIVGGFVDWCQVSAGCTHTVALRSNGTLWAWGNGFCGQLGNNGAGNQTSPVSVVGGFVDWCQAEAGYRHSLGVRSNGSLWAWGCNGAGRLGNGLGADVSSPVLVAGGFCDWCQASAGNYHSLGVRTDGTAWAWGCNSGGLLGDDTTVNKSSPVSVVGGFCDWCQVSAGKDHSLAIRTNGSAWAWGAGQSGRLGDGTTVSKSSPVSVIGGFTDWCQVSAGELHSLGVRTNGTAWAWADNVGGRLGDGTATNRSSPVSVVGGFCDWCQVSAGQGHSLAIRNI